MRKPLSMDDLHLADYSIWVGWQADGWPTTTILRGKVIVENGKLLGSAGDGQLIGSRKMSSEVAASPVC